jgi:hypothetical protein
LFLASSDVECLACKATEIKNAVLVLSTVADIDHTHLIDTTRSVYVAEALSLPVQGRAERGTIHRLFGLTGNETRPEAGTQEAT